MPESEIEIIVEYLQKNQFVITDHARREMKNDAISVVDIVVGCAGGEIVEDYPTAYPLPCVSDRGQNFGWQTTSRLSV